MFEARSWPLAPVLLALACSPRPLTARPEVSEAAHAGRDEAPSGPAASKRATAPSLSAQSPSAQSPSAPSLSAQSSSAQPSSAPSSSAPSSSAPETSGDPYVVAETAPATVCDAGPVRRQITTALFADQEFRDYVCELPCSEQAFAQEFVLRQELLRARPATWACFAEPKRQATTGLFVMFVVEGAAVRWEMSYSGIYLGTKRGYQTQGYADLEGTEREYPATWLTHHFVWNGKGYTLQSTEAVSPP